MVKIMLPGTGPSGGVFVTLRLEASSAGNGPRLSFTAVEGPKRNGDARGSCGQCVSALQAITDYSVGWDSAQATRLAELWNRWHLNDMRAGCEHQRAKLDTAEKLEVVSYGLTIEASTLRRKAIDAAAASAARHEVAALTDTGRALVLLEDWFKARSEPPDADSPLSGCFEVKKRETKTAGWVKASEHPRGLLSKPCEVCGYKYGSAWLYEEIPAEILAELRAMPATTEAHPWGDAS